MLTFVLLLVEGVLSQLGTGYPGMNLLPIYPWSLDHTEPGSPRDSVSIDPERRLHCLPRNQNLVLPQGHSKSEMYGGQLQLPPNESRCWTPNPREIRPHCRPRYAA
ncbi:hypothetical protein C8R45DRAFT_1041274 [Mycena sanguinolenta]|nr:hypothetical protein C8R45DRAFT_1041274 [Mycena sanguinolenta]